VKQLLFRLEAGLLWGLVRLLRLLSPVASSNLGAIVARTIGPILPVSRIADANLRLALPELDANARRRLVRGVWDNLGRVMAELPHLAFLRVEMVGAEYLCALAARGGPAMLFSGHVGNWEVLVPSAAMLGLRPGMVYRPAGNPRVDALLSNLRRDAIGEVPMFPKGAAGARGAVAHLRSGRILALLTDQKMNDGIEVLFFGHPAMTASATAALALRFNASLFPAHAERLGPAHYRIIVDDPLPLPTSGDRAADVAALTESMNRCVEGWIRNRPAEWLWLHRRWPKKVYT
jgi:KDO2-lipid IV(A) lauroyltransferase